jgi:hypothetical protein
MAGGVCEGKHEASHLKTISRGSVNTFFFGYPGSARIKGRVKFLIWFIV